jgi:hypothetical protein
MSWRAPRKSLIFTSGFAYPASFQAAPIAALLVK